MTSIGKGALLFFGGVLFGTAGIKALSSRDAKKAYTHCTAAALRAKKSVMETVTKVQENAEDIYAEVYGLRRLCRRMSHQRYHHGTSGERA